MQEGHNALYYAEKQKHSSVVQFFNTWARKASKKVFDAMVVEQWNKVTELITTTTSWTPQALEEKHGVRIELVAPLEADPSADMRRPVCDGIYNPIVFESICVCYPSFLRTVIACLSFRSGCSFVLNILLFQQFWKGTLLIRAARLGKEDVVHLLLDAGAAIEATCKVT